MAPVTDNTNHLHGRGLNLFIIAIVFSWVAAFLVVARLLSRYRIGRNVGKDDYVISVSMVRASETKLKTMRASFCLL